MPLIRSVNILTFTRASAFAFLVIVKNRLPAIFGCASDRVVARVEDVTTITVTKRTVHFSTPQPAFFSLVTTTCVASLNESSQICHHSLPQTQLQKCKLQSLPYCWPARLSFHNLRWPHTYWQMTSQDRISSNHSSSSRDLIRQMDTFNFSRWRVPMRRAWLASWMGAMLPMLFTWELISRIKHRKEETVFECRVRRRTCMLWSLRILYTCLVRSVVHGLLSG